MSTLTQAHIPSIEEQNAKRITVTKKPRKRVYRTLLAGYLVDHNHARDWARRLCAQKGKSPIPDKRGFDLNIMSAIEYAVEEAGGTYALSVEQEDGRMACFVTTQHKTDWFRIVKKRVIIAPKHQMVEGESEEICREFLEKNGIPFGEFEMRFSDTPLEYDEFDDFMNTFRYGIRYIFPCNTTLDATQYHRLCFFQALPLQSCPLAPIDWVYTP